ncbi:hypothetical protein M378DRAFT_159315 [Amanita muscaria Koide BX008]|uniref:Uncharacterized protein n=1 Tax=Amanita muscaria (strain Koide BX008) TaxID=946122 RepID=A0A0C2X0A6_AMAMK|nr:hypothetical protein M378DRAFT_159315 [Amanita muscaria Koide BX008]
MFSTALKRAVQSRSQNAAYRPSKRLLDHQRPSHHQFSTFYADGSLRRIHNPHSLTVPRHNVRAISYSSIPRFVARLAHDFRVPIVIVLIGVGGFTYANYRFEELKKQIAAWARETAQNVLESASDRLKVVFTRVSAVDLEAARKTAQDKLDAVSARVRDVDLEAARKTAQDKLDAVSTRVHDVDLEAARKAAQDKLEAVSARVSAVKQKLSHIETPRGLKNLVNAAKRQDHEEGSNDGDSAGSNKQSPNDR